MKKITALLLAMLTLLSLTACGTAATNGSSAPEAEQPAAETESASYDYIAPKGAKAAETSSGKPIKITVTTTHKAGGASYQCEQYILEVFKELDPEGKMFEFEMYNSGTLYKTDAEFPAILSHEVAMSFIQPSFLHDKGMEWANMLDMGYLFDSVDHLEATFNPAGELGAYLQQAIWDEFHVMSFGAAISSGRAATITTGSLAGALRRTACCRVQAS